MVVAEFEACKPVGTASSYGFKSFGLGAFLDVFPASVVDGLAGVGF